MIGKRRPPQLQCWSKLPSQTCGFCPVSGALLPVNTTNYTFANFSTVSFTFRAYDSSGNYNFCFWLASLLSTGQSLDTTPPVINNCPTPLILLRVTSTAYSSFNAS